MSRRRFYTRAHLVLRLVFLVGGLMAWAWVGLLVARSSGGAS